MSTTVKICCTRRIENILMRKPRWMSMLSVATEPGRGGFSPASLLYSSVDAGAGASDRSIVMDATAVFSPIRPRPRSCVRSASGVL